MGETGVAHASSTQSVLFKIEKNVLSFRLCVFVMEKAELPCCISILAEHIISMIILVTERGQLLKRKTGLSVHQRLLS